VIKVGDLVRYREYSRQHKRYLHWICSVAKVYEKESVYAQRVMTLSEGSWYCDLVPTDGRILFCATAREEDLIKEES
jgi:hypothetical protein